MADFDLHPFVQQSTRDSYFVLLGQVVAGLEKGIAIVGRYPRLVKDSENYADTDEFFTAADQAMVQKPEKQIEDVCGIAEGIFVYKLKQLRQLKPSLPWLDFLEVISSARRCVMKASVALENSLADLLGIKAELDYRTEIQKGLIVRRLYADFRYAIAQLDGNVAKVHLLRVARHHIAMMLRLDAYEFMRFSDRKHLVVLKQQLSQALAGQVNHQEARRLMDEVVMTAALIMGINNRQELIEHDMGRVKACVEAIDSGRLDLVPAMLHDLIGRSQKLDQLVITTVPVVKILRQVLVELDSQLSYTAGRMSVMGMG